MSTRATPQSITSENVAIEKTPLAKSSAQRISALDFTKGALVLIMVLYHWINYFVGPQWPYYFYLRFLTPSFIFITGFMVSHVYLSKYDPADSRLVKRLLVRGLKLIAIFVALNLARILVLPILSSARLVTSPLTADNFVTIFVTGNLPTTSKLVSFSILVPIAYLLMLSGALMVPYRFFKYTFHVTCALLLLFIAGLAWNDIRSLNLEFLTIGMIGVLIGFAPIAALNKLVRHPLALAFTYICYLGAITVWNVPFSLLIVGVCLNVMVIYLMGVSWDEMNKIRGEVVLLGKYSLFGYISQIAVLQLLHAMLRYFEPEMWVLVISFVASFALTIVSVELVDRARAASRNADKLYKAVFA